MVFFLCTTLNHLSVQPSLGAIPFVQRIENGLVVDITATYEMNREIQNVTEKRFDLSMSAPITMSLLRTRLGFLSDTDFANSLLAGDVHISWDVDDVTATILDEIIPLFSILREGHDVVDVTADHFRYYWRRFKERTSSSISGVHAGHYIGNSLRHGHKLPCKENYADRKGWMPSRPLGSRAAGNASEGGWGCSS